MAVFEKAKQKLEALLVERRRLEEEIDEEKRLQKMVGNTAKRFIPINAFWFLLKRLLKLVNASEHDVAKSPSKRYSTYFM